MVNRRKHIAALFASTKKWTQRSRSLDEITLERIEETVKDWYGACLERSQSNDRSQLLEEPT
jgi:hypothetical protein